MRNFILWFKKQTNFVLNEQIFTEHLLSQMLRCVAYAMEVTGKYKRGWLSSKRNIQAGKLGRCQSPWQCHCVGLCDLLVCLSEEKRHHKIRRTLES